ncbi:sensor histidine kinase [Streptomyces sp. NPDC088766]|uniref:sensor histidine kinase n=1 Tax=Streptomyces sp. NPDC088766 TaxID=3365893 RepID=UPI00380A6401
MQLLQAFRQRVAHTVHALGSERPFTRRGDLLLLAALLSPSVFSAESLAGSPGSWVAVTVLIMAGVAVRRALPLLSLVLAGLIVLFYVTLGSAVWTATATVVLSFVAGRRVTRIAYAHAVFLAVGAAGLLLVTLFAEPKDWLSLLITEFSTCALPWWAGSWWRQRADLTRAGWERAEQMEWRNRFVAEQARLKERARIAQDIHDSLGHELSVMALLAGGLELAQGLTEEQRRTMGQLRERCTMATERLHDVIGLLREDSTPSLRPAQESIAELVRRFERSGMPVRFREEGAGTRTPLLSELAAYRVVQEALTNATKHAPGAPITVRVSHRADETVVSVFNGLPSEEGRPAAPGSGSGLIGLDERVRLAGGTLRAGRRAGGFEVRAELPHEPSARVRPAGGAEDGDAEALFGRGAGRARAERAEDARTVAADGAEALSADGAGALSADGAEALGAERAGALGADSGRASGAVGGPGFGPGAGRSPGTGEHGGAAEGADASGTALARARTRVRRNLRRAALLPVLFGGVLVLSLVGLYVFTSAMTALSPGDYGRMRLGESRAELASVLPERRIRKPPPVVTEPPAPPGTVCEYYRSGDSVLTFTDTLYRLCFRDDVLVAKDTL